MNVLIATQNIEKAAIIEALLRRAGLKNDKFLNLLDVNVNIQVEERGSVLDRAIDKANYAKDNVDLNKFNIDLIVGSDDSFKDNKGNIRTDSKEFVDDVLNKNLLQIGETVNLVRAMSFINKEGEISTLETEIPFSYIGLKYKDKIRDYSYPLSYVFARVGSNNPVINDKQNTSIDYYFRFCGDDIRKIVSTLR